jgi:hypothetical protein
MNGHYGSQAGILTQWHQAAARRQAMSDAFATTSERNADTRAEKMLDSTPERHCLLRRHSV